MRCFKQNERNNWKTVRARQDSNLESSDPKSDALSIRLRGQDIIWSYTSNFEARSSVV